MYKGCSITYVLSLIIILFLVACSLNNPFLETNLKDKDKLEDKSEDSSETFINLYNGLIAYYKFNGNVDDSSGYSNHGINHGGATFVQDRFLNNNSAISFDGVDDYIEANIPGLGNVCTISLWIYDSTFNTTFDYQEPIISKQLTGTDNDAPFLLRWYHNQTIQSSVCDGHGGIDLYTSKLSLNTWYNIVIVCNGNYGYMYLNGQSTILGFGGYVSSGININDVPVFIGKYLSSYYNGLLDDIRIYNRVLSIAEINYLYNIEKP